MNNHSITWTQPAPFWSEATTQLAGVAPAEFTRPAVLRFATDSFMDEFLNVLATDPRRLGEYRVRPETWRGFLPPAPPLTPKKSFALPFQRLGAARRNVQNGRPALPTQPVAVPLPAQPLKLYQPAHQRFYLVASCLVCETPGLPDRRVDPAREETTSFVLRRLLPPGAPDLNAPLPAVDEATWEEYAFVAGPRGSFWKKIEPPPGTPANTDHEPFRRSIIENEERLPLFAVKFDADDQRERRLFAGLIPVGRREAYMAAPHAPAASATNSELAPGTTEITARKTLFRTLVSEPWKALVDRAVNFRRARAENANGGVPPAPPPATPPEEVARFRDDIQISSWLILADLRKYLATYLPDVWRRVEATTTFPAPVPDPGPLLGNALALYNALLDTRFERFAPGSTVSPPITNLVHASRATVASSLADALRRLDDSVVEAMDATNEAFARANQSPGWPEFLLPLVDTEDPLLEDATHPFGSSPVPALVLAPPFTGDDENADPVSAGGSNALAAAAAAFKQAIDRLAALVIRALPRNDTTPAPAPSAAAQTPADRRDGWFVLRCVYDRPACGPLHDDVVSRRSDRFQLASFFDPDAPARPIRIGLPLDTTPAGLRKFDKNTAFAISDVLCGQIKRIKGLTLGDLVRSVLPWPLHKDLSVPDSGPCAAGGVNIGTICSLSIPIITICAFILLIIIVTLLDIIFRWLPYFIICFPIPGLRAKQS